MMLTRAQFKRRFPAPPETPQGYVYARHNELGLCLVPSQMQQEISRRRMGNYDLYPREVRDAIKETNRKPS